MPVKIHGKEYMTVAERVNKLRDDAAFCAYGIETEIIESNDERVIMKATIKSEEGRIVAIGHAEEIRGSTQINRTSALENCETSAIGRALAALGLGGTEFASANEVQNAIQQQGDEIKDPAHRWEPGEKDEFMTQVRDAMHKGKADQLKEVWHEQSKAAIVKVWPEFDPTERAVIKKYLGEKE